MVNIERYHIEKKMDERDLDRLISSLERSTRILKRLLFIRYRYNGDSVEEASERIGITKMMGYEWQNRWNKLGYKGLIPRYARKGPSKLSSDQKEILKNMLKDGNYTTAQVRSMIKKKFDVDYTMKQIWVILKGWDMHHAKPYLHDKRRPPDAEYILKKNLGRITLQRSIIGFFDESSPQTTANTVRFWSFKKPVMVKDTSKYRANTFGFYSLNGNSVLQFQDHSRKENVCRFLECIRRHNPKRRIILVLDNFSSHHAKKVLRKARKLRIRLVFLPPYSPDLNPIEFIWKSIKRIISEAEINSEKGMKKVIRKGFRELSSKGSFARSWRKKFILNV
ncbi:MAG: IS630 family transposase [Cuniculiplasma sp.]